MRDRTWIKSLGAFIILCVLIINPYVLGKIVYHGKTIDIPSLVIILLTLDVIGLALGLTLLLRKWSRNNSKPVYYGVFFLSATAAAFLFAGALVLALERSAASLPLVLGIIFCLVALLTGRSLKRKDKRIFTFNSILYIVVLFVTLYAANMMASFFTPQWPTMGLHGVDPELGKQAWGRAVAIEGATSFNSWGQRDLERSIKPQGTRIAFVGDSFLEESSTVPLSVATERRLKDIEIINLGVSATGPDEYYYRTKNIALPLGASQCYVMFYEGNDFIESEGVSLRSIMGVVAVYPRDSVFSYLRLRSLNHLLTNDLRQVLRAWGNAGELHLQEQRVADAFASGDDSKAEDIMVSLAQPENQEEVREYLRNRNMSDFYAALRKPDNGLFRTSYLVLAIQHIEGKPQKELPIDISYKYLLQTRDVCNEQGASFVLVLVPEAFQEDWRMQQLWSPLVDMENATANRRDATERMLKQARDDGIVIVDLREVLHGSYGTYLNPDGHWSQSGVESASIMLADYINNN